jgi:hypothetical protein
MLLKLYWVIKRGAEIYIFQVFGKALLFRLWQSHKLGREERGGRNGCPSGPSHDDCNPSEDDAYKVRVNLNELKLSTRKKCTCLKLSPGTDIELLRIARAIQCTYIELHGPQLQAIQA